MNIIVNTIIIYRHIMSNTLLGQISSSSLTDKAESLKRRFIKDRPDGSAHPITTNYSAVVITAEYKLIFKCLSKTTTVVLYV